MPVSEMVEWMAMYQLDPWGEERADYRNGLAIAWDLRIASPKNKHAPQDFMHFRILPEVAATMSDVHPVQALLERIAAEGSAADERKSRAGNT